MTTPVYDSSLLPPPCYPKPIPNNWDEFKGTNQHHSSHTMKSSYVKHNLIAIWQEMMQEMMLLTSLLDLPFSIELVERVMKGSTCLNSTGIWTDIIREILQVYRL
jgi:hypothetical protein